MRDLTQRRQGMIPWGGRLRPAGVPVVTAARRDGDAMPYARSKRKPITLRFLQIAAASTIGS